MTETHIDTHYLLHVLQKLLAIPSPTGYTDQIVHAVSDELKQLGIPFELTRRGAIRATMQGKVQSPDRAIVAHLDTLGAMVKWLKNNGRLAIIPIGSWSSRFAEGCRITLFTDNGMYRGTILPLKASGHTYGDEIDTQPVSWENLEVRLDEAVSDNKAFIQPLSKVHDLQRLGVNIGDFIAIDPSPEIHPNGFINSRHLDDKAGVSTILAAAKSIIDSGANLPMDCHLLFTISEEVGSGASAVLHGDVAEMVTIDNGTPAPFQASSEFGVTIAMADSAGPFDFHLVRRLIGLCVDHDIPFQRDIFCDYRSDSASAVEAGNDIRTALITFGVDSSHGYERTHLSALDAIARLLAIYMKSDPVFWRDRDTLGSDSDFPTQPIEESNFPDSDKGVILHQQDR
ncbi:osmoprotectant NAGGN system M42 family peptidase [Candidatus Nitronereus thalassa]|uniref:Osmoprotectant NAGGN system M42 family peptidase n=1 Tax=Candidatus Nitronereus thalassa TaxID=3020898 RepID=A0ABU3KBA4_9BACT|nr:osmoprotectant NAGGN system M42 family peptidase [Candidatus Nitronereus thalassa]MDT7043699.1 osmoprotectant NAGGN system M42 family peptidase [Candidatus Nitronereus thalassa]